MSWYLLLPLGSCVALSVLGAAILARDSSTPGSRLSGILILGQAFWAACEVVWNTTADPHVALVLVKLSALAWVGIGPIGLHLVLEAIGEPATRLRAKLRYFYAVSAVFLLLDWTTPWIHTGVVPVAWGWGYELGPVYPAYWVLTTAALIGGLIRGARAYRDLPSADERAQVLWIGGGILAPLTIASVTDGVLPFLGIQVVHLGTASFVILGSTVAWSAHRHGFGILAPSVHTAEIVETMRDGLVMLRLDGKIRNANEAMAKLAGRSRRALSGVPIEDLVGCNPVDLHASGSEPGPEIEGELKPMSGKPFPVLLSTSALRSRRGVPAGFAVVIRDQREVVSLRERLLVSGRMAAVGQLAAGVAHEINNPMAYIRANLMMLRENWGTLRAAGTNRDGTGKCPEELETLWGEGEELIDESLEGVERTSAIVRGIREFSYLGSSVRERSDLNLLVEAAQRMAAPRLNRTARIEIEYGDVPEIICSPREIQQVILNILINAADAVEGAGEIRLSTRRVGEFVQLSIHDNGVGIDVDAQERIFDPFFTTKAVGEGTGLGLSISYEIVSRHGGSIEVDSAPGRGTTFRILLPIDSPPLS